MRKRGMISKGKLNRDELIELDKILHIIEIQGYGMGQSNRKEWEEMVNRLKEIIEKI